MNDPTIAFGALTAIIAIILGAIFYLQSKVNEAPDESENTENQQPVQRRRVNRATANRNARARLQAVLAERRGEELPEEEEEEFEPVVAQAEALTNSDEEDQEGDRTGLPKKKISKRKAAKLQEKAERKELRLAEEREREEKKARDELKAEEQKQIEEEEAAEEEKRLEEERKLQEERERKEQEEYEKMKAMFTVDDSGFDQAADEEAEKDLLKEFVEHIKSEKVVVLEELAARFRLKTQAVINRVTDLQADGTLTGVLDDRGKFIYISREELDGIATFIKQRGRVTLSELAEASATLVSLTPDNATAAEA